MHINISQFSQVISRYLRRLGRPVTILCRGNDNLNFYAVIEQTWHRDKTRFEPSYSPLGGVINDYYDYFGPCDIDITVLTEDDCLVCDGVKYFFVKSQCVRVGGYIQYYTGMLKRVNEEDENVFGQ